MSQICTIFKEYKKINVHFFIFSKSENWEEYKSVHSLFRVTLNTVDSSMYYMFMKEVTDEDLVWQ
jgi:hypothetical protein